MASTTMHHDLDESDIRAVAVARAIALLAVEAKGHGHAGTAMGLAPLAHLLYQRVLRHDPAHPDWEGRDRLVLSAGHASLLLYTQLHLTGYGLELDEVLRSRTLDSPRTPGHPELGHTPGVEMSTGPLGQGLASATGLAASLRRQRTMLDPDREAPTLWDPTVWVIAGDGCMQEGVSSEASSLAGTLGLDNLVVLWDDNRITIDGDTSVSFSEDVRARYRAYGWRVLDIPDVEDLPASLAVLEQARERAGAPTMVAVRSVIGAPAPTRSGTAAAHAGAFGTEEVAATLELLGVADGLDAAEIVTEQVLAHTRRAVSRGQQLRQDWVDGVKAWRKQHPGAAQGYAALQDDDARVQATVNALDGLPAISAGDSVATRSANGDVIRALHGVGALWGGSADLSSSTAVAVEGTAASAAVPGGDFVHFGVREHAMAAFLSGVALHGRWRPYGATYLAFSDYQRPALRLAALMRLPVLAVFTHDSVAVGEDGPTHQPVEQVAGLRTVPGLDVIRPADAAEVRAVWRRLTDRPEGPVALVLSRQGLPVLTLGDDGAPPPAERGGYVVHRHGRGDELALIATGSELAVAMQAADQLAGEEVHVRVVSMPCTQWFEQQSAAYRNEVLPPSLRARVVVEAGHTGGWWRYAGSDGAVVGIDEFGISGSGSEVMEHLGVTVETVIAAARRVIA